LDYEDGCVAGTIMHELGHAIGLEHTHQRTDREKVVHVDETADDYAEWASQYIITTGTDYAEMATADIPGGADHLAQAKNYYKSIMMYISDDTMKPVLDYWAVAKATPTEQETQWLADFADDEKGWMGQRTALGVFDHAVVNKAYSCYAINLKDDYAAVQVHLGQTALQVIKKIQQQKKATVPYTAIQLFTTDTTAANEVAYTATLTDNTKQYIVNVLTKFVKFKTSTKTYELYVDLGWSLTRCKANLLTFFQITAATFKKGQTDLTDLAKTLTELNVASGDTLDITV